MKKKNQSIHVIADLFSNEGKLPSSIAIWKTGTYQPSFSDPKKIKKEDLDGIISNFKKKVLGTKVSVYYSHWDSKRTAAGEVMDLWTDVERNTGETILYAEIEWTPNATKAILEKEYKYVSSEVWWNFRRAKDEKGNYEEFGILLTGIALTNEPAVHDLPPIIYSTKKLAKKYNLDSNGHNIKKTGEKKMTELLKLMGVETEDEAKSKFSSLLKQVSDLESSKQKETFSKQLKEKDSTIAELKKKIEGIEAEAFSKEKKDFLEAAFSEEKITKETMESALKYSKEQFSVLKDVVGDLKGGTLPKPEGSSANRGKDDEPENFAKYAEKLDVDNLNEGVN